MALKKKEIKKKVTKKETVKKKPAGKHQIKKKPAKKKSPKEKTIGAITHYFPKVRAAVVKLQAPLTTGDTIKIKGSTTDFNQSVTSMQIEHTPVNSAKKGQEIGLLVDSRVRQFDIITKTTP